MAWMHSADQRVITPLGLLIVGIALVGCALLFSPFAGKGRDPCTAVALEREDVVGWRGLTVDGARVGYRCELELRDASIAVISDTARWPIPVAVIGLALIGSAGVWAIGSRIASRRNAAITDVP